MFHVEHFSISQLRLQCSTWNTLDDVEMTASNLRKPIFSNRMPC